MKKIFTAVLFLFFLLVFNRQTLAYVPPDLLKQIINPCVILGNCPTNTPTPTPTQTPTPTPSPTITLTPTPTVTLTATVTITETQETTTTDLSPTLAVISAVSPTVFPSPTKPIMNASIKDIGIGLVIGFLLLLVLAQSWPRIKSWLHDKTK